MILNPVYVESGPQSSFPLQPSPPPPHLYLVLHFPLPQASLVCRVSRPSHPPVIGLHESARGA